MYEAYGEKTRGPLGIFKQRSVTGKIPAAGIEAVFKDESNEIGLTVEADDTLLIRSYGTSPVRVAFRAQPQMGKPEVVVFLHPGNNEIRTGRSQVTITPLDREQRKRIVIQGPEPRPLRLSDEEVNGLMRGIDLMRENVKAAHNEGHKRGLDEGYLQGSQPHPSNL